MTAAAASGVHFKAIGTSVIDNDDGIMIQTNIGVPNTQPLHNYYARVGGRLEIPAQRYILNNVTPQ